MKTITYQDIRSWGPCYDPAERGYCDQNWSGTALDVLKAQHVPAEDRLWVVLRPEVLDESVMRLFAVWCARRVLKRVSAPNSFVVTTVDVAERYANGLASAAELEEAAAAAYNAWRGVVGTAAYHAVAAAYYAATPDAYAGNAAAHASATSATYYASEWFAQIQHLIEMLEEQEAAE